MLDWLFSAIAVPFYEASPENRWDVLLLPYLKKWSVVAGPHQELRWAFLGMPENQPLPWAIWLAPLFWWSTFLAALFVVSIGSSMNVWCFLSSNYLSRCCRTRADASNSP